MDKRKERGEKTRQAIIDATSVILQQNGRTVLSTRAIARKAGISQSSLYHHFKGIEEIILACFKEKADQALKIEHVQQFKTIQEYLEHLLEVSVNSLQLMQNAVFSAKSLIREKAHKDHGFRLMLYQMSQEFVYNLKTNIRALAGSGVNEQDLDLVVFAYTMFREGFISFSQLYEDESLFENTPEKTKIILNLFSKYIEPIKYKSVV